MAGNSETVWGRFSGLNEAYLQDLYERYQQEPAALDTETKAFFERWGAPPVTASENGVAAPSHGNGVAPPPLREAINPPPHVVAGAVALATAIRAHGHRAARLDPLGTPPPGDAALRPESHAITEEELAGVPASVIGGPLASRCTDALSAIRLLRETYESTSGYEFEHVLNAEERTWLRTAVESQRFRPPRDPIDELKILHRLTEVGSFERFLQSTFPGQTRFSIEGLGMMVPLLDEIIGAAAESGTRVVFLGMAHRGRLNVLAHTLGKPLDEIVGEFMGRFKRPSVSPSGSSDEGWTGDVKYHLGARKAYEGGAQVEMQVVMAPNPSHLEWVNPVVVGMDRACDEQRDKPGRSRQSELYSMSVLIHGDASFPGQGIVAETFNLSQLRGYKIGGAIHIIANNQLGFTTGPTKGRSTLYASDLAKGFEVPVIHVNADDPEACIAAARLAHAYRARFKKDVLIDLIGYRRWGHNEGDEPTFTQPVMYEAIKKHPTVREIWAAELARRGLTTPEQAEAELQAGIARLQAIRAQLLAEPQATPDEHVTSGMEAGGELGGIGHAGVAADTESAVPLEFLAEYNAALYTMPEGFHLNPKLERPFQRRLEMFAQYLEARESAGQAQPVEEPRLEWAHAEALAFAATLAEGTPIRFTGQDSGRGTFSQRHALLYDAETGKRYVPHQHLPAAQASFEVWDSPLSEQAVLGFEFGYSLQAPEALVLWEAQYGDFVNVPQAMIDQFIVSARTKWDQKSGMVMLLPHGYEGQGPEHSSARPERFLQLAAEDNLRIANCTTSAQYFHILRRQARLLAQWRLFSDDPRPLILFTPKSLLRHPGAASPISEFTNGRFHPVLSDPSPGEPEAVRRLILCSGKVYYDLMAAWKKSGGQPPQIAVARVEELYPFPHDEIAEILGEYQNLAEVVWLQEEPRNMGPWLYVAPRLRDLLDDRVPLHYVGRTRRASPAEGSQEWHVREQGWLIEAASKLDGALPDEGVGGEVQHGG